MTQGTQAGLWDNLEQWVGREAGGDSGRGVYALTADPCGCLAETHTEL